MSSFSAVQNALVGVGVTENLISNPNFHCPRFTYQVQLCAGCGAIERQAQALRRETGNLFDDEAFPRRTGDRVQQEFEAYLQCGRLLRGFLRVRCDTCHAEHLVAFSCKRCEFCPSCGARRMATSAALLVDEVFPEQPVRQWGLSVPFPLRFLFASRPEVMARCWGSSTASSLRI